MHTQTLEITGSMLTYRPCNLIRRPPNRFRGEGGSEDDFGMFLEVDAKDDFSHEDYGRRRDGSRSSRNGRTAGVPGAKAPAQCHAGSPESKHESKYAPELPRDSPSERWGQAASSSDESKALCPPPPPSAQQAPQPAKAAVTSSWTATCG